MFSKAIFLDFAARVTLTLAGVASLAVVAVALAAPLAHAVAQ
jgi:hypothetical protein